MIRTNIDHKEGDKFIHAIYVNTIFPLLPLIRDDKETVNTETCFNYRGRFNWQRNETQVLSI